MSFGYSKYSFDPLNNYSNEYLYGRKMTPNLQKTTFKEDKDYVESLINTRLNRLTQQKKNYYNNDYNFQPPPQSQQQIKRELVIEIIIEIKLKLKIIIIYKDMKLEL